MQSGDDSSRLIETLSQPGGRRFALVSLGCAKNTVDSEGIGQLLAAQGYEQVQETAEADLLVVNTCGFIDTARQESIETLLELGQAKRPGQKLLATGCLTERYADEVAKEIPEIDAIVGARNWQTVPRFATELTVLPPEPRQPGSSLDLMSIAPKGTIDLEMPPRVASGPSAYLKISDGCNQKCAFCAIPSMKGLLASKPRELILQRDWRAAGPGGPRGRAGGPGQHQLRARPGRARRAGRPARAMTDAYPDLPWIRVMYAYPSHVTQSSWKSWPSVPRSATTSTCRSSTPTRTPCGGCAGRTAGRGADRLDRIGGAGRDAADDVHHRLPRRDRGRAQARGPVDRDARVRAGRRLPLFGRRGHGRVRPAESDRRRASRCGGGTS